MVAEDDLGAVGHRCERHLDAGDLVGQPVLLTPREREPVRRLPDEDVAERRLTVGEDLDETAADTGLEAVAEHVRPAVALTAAPPAVDVCRERLERRRRLDRDGDLCPHLVHARASTWSANASSFDCQNCWSQRSTSASGSGRTR